MLRTLAVRLDASLECSRMRCYRRFRLDVANGVVDALSPEIAENTCCYTLSARMRCLVASAWLPAMLTCTWRPLMKRSRCHSLRSRIQTCCQYSLRELLIKWAIPSLSSCGYVPFSLTSMKPEPSETRGRRSAEFIYLRTYIVDSRWVSSNSHCI